MKLTKTQLKRIKEELIAIEKEIEETQKGLLEHSSTFGVSSRETNDPADYVTVNRNAMLRKRRQELEGLLRTADVIKISQSETIELGSKFKIRFDDGEEETLTLVGTASHYENVFNYISIDCPLGQNVLGKKEGEEFSYKVEGETISGCVLSIIKTTSKQKVKS